MSVTPQEVVLKTVRNMLYRCPELYEAVYNGADNAVPRLCEKLFYKHLGHSPDGLLDVGCGTGRDLACLAEWCTDCLGVDYQRNMIEYARRVRPAIDFRTGDMRTMRLDRTFEAIISFGYVIANVHDNDEISQVVATYAAHSRPGTLLMLEVINTEALTAMPAAFTIDTPGFHSEAEAVYETHPYEQLLERRRKWHVRDGEDVQDEVRFRLLYPQELCRYLGCGGFEVVEFVDGTCFEGYALTEASLFVVARYVGERR